MCDCPIYFALDMKKRLIGIIVVGVMVLLMGCSGDKAQRLPLLPTTTTRGVAMV